MKEIKEMEGVVRLAPSGVLTQPLSPPLQSPHKGSLAHKRKEPNPTL